MIAKPQPSRIPLPEGWQGCAFITPRCHRGGILQQWCCENCQPTPACCDQLPSNLESEDSVNQDPTPHCLLLERNLLYTAVTPGKKLLVVIGQMKALAMALKRVGSVKRLPNLKHRLSIAKT
jgi:hypothetical protein